MSASQKDQRSARLASLANKVGPPKSRAIEPDAAPATQAAEPSESKKEEFQLTTVKMTKEQHRKLKVLAIEQGSDMSALIRRAVDEWLRR